MHSISLRPATLSDALAVANLGAKVYAATFGHSVTKEQMNRYLEESYSIEATESEITSKQKDMVVATDGESGAIVGFALLTRGSTEPCIEQFQDTVELQRIYVDTEAHGRGIGKRLILKVEEMAREQGFRHVWLGVWEHNLKARKVYEGLGYAYVGYHDFDLGGDIQKDDILIKTL